MSAFVHYLSTDSSAVYWVAILILAGAASAYVFWFSRNLRQLEKPLNAVSKALDKPAGDWRRATEDARAAAKTSPVVATAWQDTEQRVIRLPRGEANILATLGAPRDLWSSQRLLTRTFNLPLAESVPNILVGIGLLFTFIFLTIALTQATTALVSQSGTQADILGATRGLLSAAGAKFITSLAGLLASILWTLAARKRMTRLTQVCEDIVDRIARLVPPIGSEMIVASQLHSAIELEKSVVELGKSVEGQLHATEELLFEAREQTGSLKRFETDLAVTLAGAITQAFTPQMEAMTNRLTSAIDNLSGKLGAMNQGALEKMLTDFAVMLKQATESEMGQLRQSLEILAERLAGAAISIEGGAGRAGEALTGAGDTLSASIGDMAATLAAGAANLDEASSSIKLALNDLDVSIVEAAELGREGQKQFRTVLGEAGNAIDRMSGLAKGFAGLVSSLEGAAAKMADTTEGVDTLSAGLQEVVDAVTVGAPAAIASISSVSESLEKASKGLVTTVDSMTGGVTEYTVSVLSLHKTMDGLLAKAIGTLNTTVDELTETLEEFNENLEAQRSGS